jgi:hypothetical protein
MKKLFTLAAVIGASLVAIKGNAQVYVNAHIGLPVPVRPVYAAPPPVYQDPYAYPDASGAMGYEDEFPGYAYYDYPAWNGHYRDYYYYAHYRPFFERRFAGYFNGGRFDYGRFRQGNYGGGWGRPGYGGRGVNHGFGDRGIANRGFDRGGFANHNGYGGHAGFAGNGGGHRAGFGGHAGFAGHGGFAGHAGGGGSHGGRR